MPKKWIKRRPCYQCGEGTGRPAQFPPGEKAFFCSVTCAAEYGIHCITEFWEAGMNWCKEHQAWFARTQGCDGCAEEEDG